MAMVFRIFSLCDHVSEIRIIHINTRNQLASYKRKEIGRPSSRKKFIYAKTKYGIIHSINMCRVISFGVSHSNVNKFLINDEKL